MSVAEKVVGHEWEPLMGFIQREDELPEQIGKCSCGEFSKIGVSYETWRKHAAHLASLQTRTENDLSDPWQQKHTVRVASLQGTPPQEFCPKCGYCVDLKADAGMCTHCGAYAGPPEAAQEPIAPPVRTEVYWQNEVWDRINELSCRTGGSVPLPMVSKALGTFFYEQTSGVGPIAPEPPSALAEAAKDLLEVIYTLDGREDLPEEFSGELIDRLRAALMGLPEIPGHVKFDPADSPMAQSAPASAALGDRHFLEALIRVAQESFDPHVRAYGEQTARDIGYDCDSLIVAVDPSEAELSTLRERLRKAEGLIANWESEGKRIYDMAHERDAANPERPLMAQSVRYWTCARELRAALGSTTKEKK